MGKQRAVIFGIGTFYQIYKKQIYHDFDVVALIDNSPTKKLLIIDGFKVSGIEVLSQLEYEVICITTNPENSYEIRNQLERMGIGIERMRFQEPGGIYPYKIPKSFFATNLSVKDKKRMFSENIERVIIEINSRCNRRCWFCPNSITDRSSENIDMEDEVFDAILQALHSIDYSNEICFSYFNEPLCSSKIFQRIHAIRGCLPKAFLYLFSNGDYIQKETLDRLAQSGLNLVKIDVYTNDLPGNYSETNVKRQLDKLLERLDIAVDDHCLPPVIARAHTEGMDIEIITQDFSATACNRAESLPSTLPIPQIQQHNNPCIKNFISFHIAYNGNVYPCPNMHTGIENHQQFCVGNVHEANIFDIYLGDKLQKFRESNFFHRELLPCRSCIWNFDTFITNRFDHPFRDRPINRIQRSL